MPDNRPPTRGEVVIRVVDTLCATILQGFLGICTSRNTLFVLVAIGVLRTPADKIPELIATVADNAITCILGWVVAVGVVIGAWFVFRFQSKNEGRWNKLIERKQQVKKGQQEFPLDEK